VPVEEGELVEKLHPKQKREREKLIRRCLEREGIAASFQNKEWCLFFKSS
jgi:hypothetical protein